MMRISKMIHNLKSKQLKRILLKPNHSLHLHQVKDNLHQMPRIIEIQLRLPNKWAPNLEYKAQRLLRLQIGVKLKLYQLQINKVKSKTGMKLLLKMIQTSISL